MTSCSSRAIRSRSPCTAWSRITSCWATSSRPARRAGARCGRRRTAGRPSDSDEDDVGPVLRDRRRSNTSTAPARPRARPGAPGYPRCRGQPAAEAEDTQDVEEDRCRRLVHLRCRSAGSGVRASATSGTTTHRELTPEDQQERRDCFEADARRPSRRVPSEASSAAPSDEQQRRQPGVAPSGAEVCLHTAERTAARPRRASTRGWRPGPTPGLTTRAVLRGRRSRSELIGGSHAGSRECPDRPVRVGDGLGGPGGRAAARAVAVRHRGRQGGPGAATGPRRGPSRRPMPWRPCWTGRTRTSSTSPTARSGSRCSWRSPCAPSSSTAAGSRCGFEKWAWRVAPIAAYVVATAGVFLDYWTQWTGQLRRRRHRGVVLPRRVAGRPCPGCC